MKTKAEVVMYLNANTLSTEWPRGQPIDDWAVDCIKFTVKRRGVVSLAFAHTEECFVCFAMNVCNEERG